MVNLETTQQKEPRTQKVKGVFCTRSVDCSLVITLRSVPSRAIGGSSFARGIFSAREEPSNDQRGFRTANL